MKANTEAELQPIRLPEWRACLDAIRANGVAYGAQFKLEFFETNLRIKAVDYRFSLAISKIRKELEKDGFYLSGRGGRGKLWTVVAPATNRNVMCSYSRSAARALARGVVLGTNTRLDELTPDERRKHEDTLERMATKAALMARSSSFRKLLKE